MKLTEFSNYYFFSAGARITDGVMDKTSHFFHSKTDRMHPWLMIDLEIAYVVHAIRVLPRQNELTYHRFAKISVSEGLYSEWETVHRDQKQFTVSDHKL